MPRPRRLVLYALTALALQALPSSEAAQPPPSPEKAAARLEQVQKEIRSQRDQIEEAQIKVLNLQQDINRIASQIKKHQATLLELQEALHRQEELIRAKDKELAAIGRQKAAMASHVEKRLAAFYQTGEVGLLNALFAAGDLGELLNLKEYIQALVRHDQETLASFRAEIDRLHAARDEQTKAKERQETLIHEAKEAGKALIASQKERDKLLKEAEAEERLYGQALKELEAAAAKLTKTIDQAKQAAARAAKKGARSSATAAMADTGFAGRKGHLPPPAKGQVRRKFGPYQDNFGNQLHNEGLDLEVAPGAKVTAIHAGRIIFADQMPGYGRMIIIDHGGQYYSLVSGLAAFSRKKNDPVRAGETIGTAEAVTGPSHPGLHLEIRQGAKPQDPLLWLDHRQLE